MELLGRRSPSQDWWYDKCDGSNWAGAPMEWNCQGSKACQGCAKSGMAQKWNRIILWSESKLRQCSGILALLWKLRRNSPSSAKRAPSSSRRSRQDPSTISDARYRCSSLRATPRGRGGADEVGVRNGIEWDPCPCFSCIPMDLPGTKPRGIPSPLPPW